MSEAPLTLEEVIAGIDAAHEKVVALCTGAERWVMRVPADPSRDPDLVIGSALRAARKVVLELRAARDEAAELKAAIREWVAAYDDWQEPSTPNLDRAGLDATEDRFWAAEANLRRLAGGETK